MKFIKTSEASLYPCVKGTTETQNFIVSLLRKWCSPVPKMLTFSCSTEHHNTQINQHMLCFFLLNMLSSSTCLSLFLKTIASNEKLQQKVVETEKAFHIAQQKWKEQQQRLANEKDDILRKCKDEYELLLKERTKLESVLQVWCINSWKDELH